MDLGVLWRYRSMTPRAHGLFRCPVLGLTDLRPKRSKPYVFLLTGSFIGVLTHLLPMLPLLDHRAPFVAWQRLYWAGNRKGRFCHWSKDPITPLEEQSGPTIPSVSHRLPIACNLRHMDRQDGCAALPDDGKARPAA